MTYNNLYRMVVNTIRNMTNYPDTDTGIKQLARTQVLDPVMMTARGADVDASNVLGLVHNILISTFNPRILSGLIVEATDPTSASVTISAGHGAIGVNIYRLSKSQTVKIPFDNDTYIFYVNLYSDGAKIERTTSPSQLTLAKIIIPKPGTTSVVKDDEGDDFPWDAYIINLKEIKLYGNNKGKFEENSLQFLKNNIGDILADNIIGNITLNENLKVVNAASSLELNSNSMLIKDADENVVAKFNRNGTFFYDTNGVELAKFSVDGARIGNIVVNKDSIQSGNLVSGALGVGFRIKDSGDAEFNNVFVRGKMSSSVFEYNTVSAMGGNLLVSHDADKLDQDMTAISTALITDGDVTFASGDVLWLKDGTNSEYMTVSGVTSATTYTVTRASGGSAVAWTKGTAIVNLGQSGDGGIFITASESDAPYLSVFTHDGSPWTGLSTKLRIGNLNGFLGYSTDLYGVAIGETEKYLKYDPTNGLRVKGNITVTGGNAAVTFYQDAEPSGEGEKQGDYWIDTDDNNALYVYNSGSWTAVTGGDAITTFRQSAIPTALNAGDLWIDTDNQNLYRATSVGDDEITAGEWEVQDAAVATGWSHTSDTTKIDGGDIYTSTVVADSISVSELSAIAADLGTITSGTVTGATIRTSATNPRIEMTGDTLKIYDAAGNTVVTLGDIS